MKLGLKFGLEQLWIKMYNANMQKAFKSIPVPKDFRAAIVDYDTFLTIRFYESQWKHYTEAERFKCVQYMINVKSTLERLGAVVAIDPVLDVETPKDRAERRRRK
jgi:hypothetical protein